MCLDRRQLKGGDIESDWNGSLDHSVAKCIIMEWWWWWKIKLWKIKCDGRRWQWAKAAIRDEDAIRSNQNDEKKFYVCITMKNVMVLFARCSWKIMVPVVINIRWNSNFYSRFWHFVSTFRVSDAWKLKWAILYVCVCATFSVVHFTLSVFVLDEWKKSVCFSSERPASYCLCTLLSYRTFRTSSN